MKILRVFFKHKLEVNVFINKKIIENIFWWRLIGRKYQFIVIIHFLVFCKF